jgi:hypothetical protein
MRAAKNEEKRREAGRKGRLGTKVASYIVSLYLRSSCSRRLITIKSLMEWTISTHLVELREDLHDTACVYLSS